MKSFGQRAERWSRGRPQSRYVVADDSGFGAAFVAIVESKRIGESVGFLPLVEEPRRRLLRFVAAELTQNTTYDHFRERLSAFAAGKIAINGTSQTEHETSSCLQAAGPFAHAGLCADRVVFRSHYEAELADRSYAYRPSSYEIVAPADPDVPSSVPVSGGAHIAVWVTPGDEPFASIATRALSDMPIEIRTVGPGDSDAATLLGSARVIVSPSDDPGTAIALSQFQRPLCVATHGAREYLCGVATFDIWNTAALIEGVQIALASGAPRRLTSPETLEEPKRAASIPEHPPLVSVIMTVYDRLGHLERNLERLQLQTYPNVEIVVVSNNGPRADDICARYSNVRYIHREENSGTAGETRNDGIAASTGEYIFALDDDDIIFNDHIATMVEICERGADVVYNDFLIQIVEPVEGRELLVGYDIEIGSAITAYELMVQNRLAYMAVFARRSVYEAFEVAYDQVGVFGASEVELWLRMARHFVLVKAPHPTTIYTIRQNWKGSATAVHHGIWAGGYEKMYERYPSRDLPIITERRTAHLASLRSTQTSAPRNARYLVERREV